MNKKMSYLGILAIALAAYWESRAPVTPQENPPRKLKSSPTISAAW